MISLATPWVTDLLRTWTTEAMQAWGLFTTILAGLGFAYFRSEHRSKAKDEEIKALRADNARLQDLRLQDAQKMIQVAETGTATMAARSEGDARFRDLMSILIATVTQQQKGVIQLPPPENR